MLRYAITDRTQYGRFGPESHAALLEQSSRLAAQGVDFIQLREKHLPADDVAGIARGMISAIRGCGCHTRFLVNARLDIALAVGADGVHLPSGENQLTPAQVRRLFAAYGLAEPIVSVSCHTFAEVQRALDRGASLILFGPVFGKWEKGELVVPGTGLESLRAARDLANPTPLLALGGVTDANLSSCIEAGAAGVAAIRLFL